MLQAVTVLISGFVNFALEGKYHGFEWEKSYTTTPIKIVAMILFTELIGGSRCASNNPAACAALPCDAGSRPECRAERCRQQQHTARAGGAWLTGRVPGADGQA